MAKKTATKKTPAKKTAKTTTKKKAPAKKKAAPKKKAAKAEDEEGAPKKKAKAKKKPAKKRASRAAKVIRLKAFWGVFNQSLKRVALFEFHERKLADKKAAELGKGGKSPHFVQPVKEAIEE